MPGPIPFHEFKRKLKSLGITLKQGGKATHFRLEKQHEGVTLYYGIARHGNEVKAVYVKGTLKAFHISQDEFDNA